MRIAKFAGIGAAALVAILAINWVLHLMTSLFFGFVLVAVVVGAGFFVSKTRRGSSKGSRNI